MGGNPTRRMVYHTPLPLNPDARTASGLRPLKMKEAFERLGYEVWLVSGYSSDRRAAMRRVKDAMATGTAFEFCYSESSTMPMTMTDRHHLPLHPLLDRRFFDHLRRAGVPVGHFLRDIFWRFPEYRASVRPPKREAALAAYAFDQQTLRHHVDRVFLPSEPMASYLNLGSTPVTALPPGHGYDAPIDSPKDGVRLFYVGGIGAHYRLQTLFEGVQKAAAAGIPASLTVCTTSEYWQLERSTYEQWLCDAVKVVHAHGEALRPHLEAANVGALFVEPDDYWTFAVPVKQFEYLGAGKPILAADGSLTGDFVRDNGIGWTLPYRADALVDQLRCLAADASLIDQARTRVLTVRRDHTWVQRARQVAEALV